MPFYMVKLPTTKLSANKNNTTKFHHLFSNTQKNDATTSNNCNDSVVYENWYTLHDMLKSYMKIQQPPYGSISLNTLSMDGVWMLPLPTSQNIMYAM